MKVIFLTNNVISKSLSDWLTVEAKDKLTIFDGRLTSKDLEILKPEFLISYNYKFIIKKEILDYFPSKAINLHISYLPFNKGAHPNLWSIVENTPKGVTIHQVDEGLDTGDILFQKKIVMDECVETLDSSYQLLHSEIQKLLKKNWHTIKSGYTKPKKQSGIGSFHIVKDFEKYIAPVIQSTGWNISINKFVHKYDEYNKNRQKESRR